MHVVFNAKGSQDFPHLDILEYTFSHVISVHHLANPDWICPNSLTLVPVNIIFAPPITDNCIFC